MFMTNEPIKRLFFFFKDLEFLYLSLIFKFSAAANSYDSHSAPLHRTERQWCDLAISLSLLSMCERGFKRLQECWECYSDKLTEPGVYQPLLSITAKLRRGAKPQFKVPYLGFLFKKKCCRYH